jgi:type IV pilus assembly protein PilE
MYFSHSNSLFSSPNKRAAFERGFTLIELMIAMAILAVISAVAVPIYTSYSENTYRGEAQADLLMCAQGMERFASENFTYIGADDGSGGVLTTICNPLSDLRYDISVVAARDSFTLTATPKAGIMAGDGAMEYGSNGQRRWDKQGGGWQDNWQN